MKRPAVIFVLITLALMLPCVSSTMELDHTTVNLPLTGNFTVSLYQNNAGQVCIRDFFYDTTFGYDTILEDPGNDLEFTDLFCSGGRFNLYSPEGMIRRYSNAAKAISPGGWVYEEQKTEKTRREAARRYAMNNPEWNLKCINRDCILSNILNQTTIHFKVANITVIDKEGGSDA
jgi:hypothetical protein